MASHEPTRATCLWFIESPVAQTALTKGYWRTRNDTRAKPWWLLSKQTREVLAQIERCHARHDDLVDTDHAGDPW